MPSEASHDGLLECLGHILNGEWAFIQLRDDTPDANSIDGDDIDLLATEESVMAVIVATQQWVRKGLCHVHIVRQRRRKVEMLLFSLDGAHYLHFDLWIELPQLDGGKQSLCFEEMEHCAKRSDGSFLRLPIDVEACLFLQHLVCKRKRVTDDKQLRRLLQYEAKCVTEGYDDLAQRLAAIRQSGVVSSTDAAFSLTTVTSQLGSRSERTADSRLKRVAQAMLSAPRKTKWVSIMGCDGAGKTSLATQICKDTALVSRVYTGKHLYRKSLIYKLAVIFVRPLTFQSRENFDEIIAPLVYLRACLGLRLKLLFAGSGNTFVDRALPDFLYLNRKTDHPRFSRLSALMGVFGKRIPVVHCMASYENVSRRKDEITEAGHRQYDDAMFLLHGQRCPTNYLAFNNDAALKESAESLSRIAASIWFVKNGRTPN
ncbi:hypothetical protein [Fuerstiella marisgermanici]|uniref:Uncharacterized protein n=1 Tax=Fuerstiella marisgermanici TaxID=1891926 RepID=A0A1P8W964_9PLAN|nr:hypothetical protein [Fuerstiella marisgermanici]APZ90579.1 hypothetical protein Fuma_00159 [Fuerstiella marisgermanici]